MNEQLKSAQESLRIQGVFLRNNQTAIKESEFDPDLLVQLSYVTQEFNSVSDIKEATYSNQKQPEKSEIFEYRFSHTNGIRVISEGDEEAAMSDDYEPYIVIIATFEAKYLSSKRLKEAELEAFSEENVGYHVRPYWREYVQSSCARIGLNPFLKVPMLRCSNQ